jgi:hypothetical protein
VLDAAVNDIFSLDATVGHACIAWRSGDRRQLADLHERAVQCERMIIATLRDTAANVLHDMRPRTVA